MHQQVHAISSKAADVRPMVMALNAKRQARDEAATDEVLRSDAAENQQLLSEADSDKQHHQNTISDVDWQEFDEVRPPCQVIIMYRKSQTGMCLLSANLLAINLQMLQCL